MDHPPLVFTVRVDYSVGRPIIPDQRSRKVIVVADDHLEAMLTATFMVMGRPDCCMVTRTTITDVVC